MLVRVQVDMVDLFWGVYMKLEGRFDVLGRNIGYGVRKRGVDTRSAQLGKKEEVD